MRIKELLLKDIFSYYGIHSIKFDKFTFIIGENGFGKTAILNSIKLALGKKDIDKNSILNSESSEKNCYIEVDFEEFKIKREWDFKENIERVEIKLEDEVLEDFEAEEFIKEKFPLEIIDFIFFDGEVEKNLIISKKSHLKKLFEHIFDLDIFANMKSDCLRVAKKLLKDIESIELQEFQGLESKSETILKEIESLKLKIENDNLELKKLNLELKNLELKVKTHSKAIANLKEKLNIKNEELEEYLKKFREINLYQMPLILNNMLLKNIENKNINFIEIKSENEFKNKFTSFYEMIKTDMSEEELLREFYNIFANSILDLNLKYSKDDFKDILENIKRVNIEIENIEEKLKNVRKKSTDEILNELEKTQTEKLKNREILEFNLIDSEKKLETLNLENKEVEAKLRIEFINKREKFANIKSYEELFNISKGADKIYILKLKQNLEDFNKIFAINLKPFLAKYHHISKIFLNEDFNIILLDKKESTLNLSLISAGQKQILSFLIINSVLEFKNFSDFMLIDTPFGRLSNENRDFILNDSYMKFENLTLLMTSSEFDYIKTKNLNFKEYHLAKNMFGTEVKYGS